MFKRGLLSLSGDPITFGHLDIINRAMQQCEHLIVAVLNNPDKKSSYVFELDERLKLAEKTIKDYCDGENFEVISSEDSMLDIYLDYNCDVIFRGARDEQDLEYETQQMKYYEMILPSIKNHVIIFKADPKLKHVQSTVVRNFTEQHLDVTSMVPMYIQARLWRRIHGQKIFGITGNKNVGKTTLINAALEVIRSEGIPGYHIDLQNLREKVLTGTTPGIEKLKTLIGNKKIEDCDQETKNLYFAHLSRLYRQKLKGRKGVILVEDSRLIEDSLYHWVNNNVILITSDVYGKTDATATIVEPEIKLQTARKLADTEKYGIVFAFPNDAKTFLPGLGGIIVAKVRGGNS